MILRVYSQREWVGDRELDWERCRTCEGTGRAKHAAIHALAGVMNGPLLDEPGTRPCPTCGAFGSLKAAVRAHFVGIQYTGLTDGLPRPIVRCEDCWHPMSEGTWEAPQGSPPGHGTDGTWGPPNPVEHAAYLTAVERWLRDGDDDPRWAWVHYSPCDEGCRHGGPTFIWGDLERTPQGDENTAAGRAGELRLEASWRPVDVRRLSWPHDLRPEMLAVLCLRCLAERGRA